MKKLLLCLFLLTGLARGATTPVVDGGTGQTSYTNGQLLIGNTTGNTLDKNTLTGTANGVTVTNGAGAITLGLASSIELNTSLSINGTAVYLNGTTGQMNGGYLGLSANLITGDADLSFTLKNTAITDGATKISHILDQTNTFSTAGAKLLSVRNNVAEKFAISYDGSFYGVGSCSANAASFSTTISINGSGIVLDGDGSILGTAGMIYGTTLKTGNNTVLGGSTGTLLFKNTGITDGATKIGTTIDTTQTLSTAGAKLLSIKNAGTEKLSIAHDGAIVSNSGLTVRQPASGDGFSLLDPANGHKAVLMNVTSGAGVISAADNTGAVKCGMYGATGLFLSTGSDGFSGVGANLTALNANNIANGTVSITHGGTGYSGGYANGELLIGNNTGTGWTKSTLTAGTGISITNGAGSITIAQTASTVIALGVSPWTTAVGYNAGSTITGANCTAMGFESLNTNNMSGTDCSAFGYKSGTVNATGSHNAAFGSKALMANTSGSANTAMGSNVLAANTSGGSNVAAGKNSMNTNTTGSQNAAVGVDSLKLNSTGNDCAAVGYLALNHSTVDQNTAVGSNALNANTTGTPNTGIGYQALLNNLTGGNNAALGASALRDVAGSGNTGVGSSALKTASTGGDNTGVGYLAGYGDGSNNQAIVSDQQCTFVGSNATRDVTIGTHLTNAAAFGYNAKVAADNTMVLGNTSTTVVMGGSSGNANAIMDLQSTSKAFMPPRMTAAQKNAVGSPTAGMVLFDSDLGRLCVYNGSAWEPLGQTTTVSAQTATYTLVIGDVGRTITMSSTSSTTVHIPTDASVNFPVGTQITVVRINTGAVSVDATTSGTTTVNSSASAPAAPVLRVRYSSATLIKLAANLWLVVGDIV